MAEFNKGTSIKITILYDQINTSDEYADIVTVTTPLITIYDKDDTKVVTAGVPTKEDDGKYIYYVQTSRNWQSGDYRSDISGVVGSYTGVKITNGIFKLI